MKAEVRSITRLDDASSGVRVYRVTVTGPDVLSHRRLAAAGMRSYAREHGLGRVEPAGSAGSHGISHFTFRTHPAAVRQNG